MTIGLFEGWQHFADDLRSDNPLLPSETWVQVLKDCEYFNAAAFPRPGSPAEDLGVHLIVGRVSEIAADDQNEAAQPVSAPAAVAGPADPKISGFSDRIREAISGERDDLIYEFVLEQVVTVLKLDPSQRPGARHRLLDLGFDSLMAVQLRNRLGAGLSLARPLPATLLFDYPTIEAIKNYILELLFPAVRAPTAKAAAAPILDEASVAAMPDAEIERLLLERLGSA
jgi:acyl carrier protein